MEDLFRLQLREQDHVADAFLTQQHHAQTVNADADAASGRHAVFERDEKILIQFLLFAAGLMFQRGALGDGIVLLGVTRRNFLAVDAALEDLDGRRVVGRKLGGRHEFLGQMRDERGLNERRLDHFFNINYCNGPRPIVATMRLVKAFVSSGNLSSSQKIQFN